MELTRSKRYFLLALPALLTSSTALAFSLLARWLGNDLGYLLGFGFYWAWCLVAALVCLGKDGFLSLFKEESPLMRKENWLLIMLISLPVIGAAVMYFIPNVATVSIWVVIFSPIAIINGTCEEILWRGVYAKAFRHSVLLACVYPTTGFAISHVSPALVFPAEGGTLPFVLSTFALGLAYGWVAYKTGSARWTALSHSLAGLLAFGEPLSTSIVTLVFS